MKKYNKQYIKIFAGCIPVKGAIRSLIVDTQRNTFKFITNDLFELITRSESVKIADVYIEFGSVNKKIIDEYLEFLLTNEFAFLTDSPDDFTSIDENWESPRAITNAIIDIDKNSNYNIDGAIRKIDLLGTEALQIRFFDIVSFSEFKKISDSTYLNTKRLRSVQFVIKYSEHTLQDEFINLLTDNLLTSEVIIHSCKFSKILPTGFGFSIIYTKEKINDSNNCGCINPSYFSPNLNHVNESRNFNTCLNKKLSIDVNGLIKNCPSMNKSFGEIDEKPSILTNIINNKEFIKAWSIKKDQIETCKDCEFRLICTDCRAYVSHELDKPVKCNYNPYKAKWGN
jgi:SPASM domain peptide maturase of grasp-with-spasm system